jgi:hypothetical protein
MRGIIIVHRGTPAKDVMTDEKSGQDPDSYGNECNSGESRELEVKLKQCDWFSFRKRRLDEVVKGPVPVVDRYADLNLKVGREQDQG